MKKKRSLGISAHSNDLSEIKGKEFVMETKKLPFLGLRLLLSTQSTLRILMVYIRVKKLVCENIVTQIK